MPRPHSDRADGEMHARLSNWAQWARGRPNLECRRTDNTSPDPVESDAQEMEAALVVMKRRRSPLWDVVYVRYITRRDDILGSDRLRMGVSTYQARMRQAYSWLHGYLEREA